MSARLRAGLVFAAALGAASFAHGQQAPIEPPPAGAVDAQLARALSDAEAASAQAQRARAELDGLVAGQASAEDQLRRRARALYRITRGAPPWSGGLPALLAHLGRVERLERMVSGDARALCELRARTDALRSETARLEAAQAEARERAEEIETRRAALEEEARRAALYAPAFGETVASSYDPTTGYGIRVVGEPPAPRSPGFAELRGQLALPLLSPRTMREATRENGAGLEIDGERGAGVRTAAGGRVAFSERHPAYGRLVILDHDGGWFTVYGGLSRVDVAVGDRLSRGMTLGVLDGEPLFFQVRRGTRPQDARAWLGL